MTSQFINNNWSAKFFANFDTNDDRKVSPDVCASQELARNSNCAISCSRARQTAAREICIQIVLRECSDSMNFNKTLTFLVSLSLLFFTNMRARSGWACVLIRRSWYVNGLLALSSAQGACHQPCRGLCIKWNCALLYERSKYPRLFVHFFILDGRQIYCKRFLIYKMNGTICQPNWILSTRIYTVQCFKLLSATQLTRFVWMNDLEQS